MKKTISINIASTAFFIDEDAYSALKDYLNKIEAWFRDKEGGQEIISDIESRLSELFCERVNPQTGVVTVSHVTEVIRVMGQPEDIIGEGEDEPVSGPKKEKGFTFEAPRHRRLYRDPENKVLGGVCSGIAAYFNLDPVLVRVVFAVLPFLSFGVIIPIYIVLWLAIPDAITTAQKLEMRGESINVENIEKKIREEYQDVKGRFENFKDTKAYRDGESFLSRMEKRDKTVLLVAGLVILAIFMGKLIAGSVNMMHMGPFPFPFFNFHFPGIFIMVLVLVALGLTFRSALKGFMVLILVLIVLSIILGLTNVIHPFENWGFFW
jgi:phage shock protein PspC (stress-responsive transcriptional regulator)